MKKKLVAIVAAATLMFALPTLAWAAPSPSNQGSASGSNGVSIVAKAGSGSIESVASTSTTASNVPAGANVLSSFEIAGDAKDVTVSFNVGAQYAGYSVTVYIQHDDGTTEAKTATVSADGTISVHVDGLSIFTVVLGEKGAAPSADTSAKSPQTGVDLGTVAGATVVTAIAAGAVFVALRKKVTE